MAANIFSYTRVGESVGVEWCTVAFLNAFIFLRKKIRIKIGLISFVFLRTMTLTQSVNSPLGHRVAVVIQTVCCERSDFELTKEQNK